MPCDTLNTTVPQLRKATISLTTQHLIKMLFNADKRARAVAAQTVQGTCRLFSASPATAAATPTLQYPFTSSPRVLSQVLMSVTGHTEPIVDLTHDTLNMDGEASVPL